MHNQVDLADHPPGTRFLLYAPEQMQAIVDAMAGQAASLIAGVEKVAVVGILRRGAPLADRLSEALVRRFKVDAPLRLDLKIKRYADDLTLLHPYTQLTEQPEQVALDLTGYHLLVVDDVLYTGHSMLRAVEWLAKRNPAAVHGVVLVDRHVVQLPLKADVVGVHLQVAPPDVVECHVPPYEPLFQIEVLRLNHGSV